MNIINIHMKRQVFYISAFILAILILSSCIFDFTDSVTGNGNLTTENRDIADFSSIRASGGLKVKINIGKEYSVSVEADENLQEYILTEVHSGELNIATERNIRHAKARNVIVTLPELNEISVSGAADVSCETLLKTDKFDADVSSAGKLEMEIKAKEIILEASSSGKIKIFGESDQLRLNVSSAGSIDADKLMVKYCKASASSAGSASLWVTDEIEADASSAGSLVYKGDPGNKNISTSSAGSISHK